MQGVSVSLFLCCSLQIALADAAYLPQGEQAAYMSVSLWLQLDTACLQIALAGYSIPADRGEFWQCGAVVHV